MRPIYHLRLFIVCMTCLAFAYVASENRANAAQQQPNCGSEQAILAALAKDYGEVQIASFLDSQGTLLRLLINTETRTWTLVGLSPTGRACLVAYGNAFEPETSRETRTEGPAQNVY